MMESGLTAAEKAEYEQWAKQEQEGSAMLSQLVDINGNTRRLESMEESMYAVKNSLANIEIRGVKITE